MSRDYCPYHHKPTHECAATDVLHLKSDNFRFWAFGLTRNATIAQPQSTGYVYSLEQEVLTQAQPVSHITLHTTHQNALKGTDTLSQPEIYSEGKARTQMQPVSTMSQCTTHIACTPRLHEHKKSSVATAACKTMCPFVPLSSTHCSDAQHLCSSLGEPYAWPDNRIKTALRSRVCGYNSQRVA